MKSKTKIEKQLKRKTNKELVETVILAKKNKNWFKVAEIISSPKRINVNLSDLDKFAKNGETIVVPGKVLSNGEITKKIKVIAKSFSKKAEEKLLKSKIEISNIIKEIKKNPEAKGIKILK